MLIPFLGGFPFWHEEREPLANQKGGVRIPFLQKKIWMRRENLWNKREGRKYSLSQNLLEKERWDGTVCKDGNFGFIPFAYILFLLIDKVPTFKLVNLMLYWL